MKIFGRREINKSSLSGFDQIEHVLERTFALGVPQHYATFGFLDHDEIFGRVVGKISALARGRNATGGPSADVVAAFLHAKHDHVAVASLCKVLLDSLIRAVGVADENGIAALDKIVNSRTQGGIQLRDCPRTADKNIHTKTPISSSR